MRGASGTTEQGEALPQPHLHWGHPWRSGLPAVGEASAGAADTRDVEGTVEQVKRCVDAGAEIVRITVQGKKEATACMAIREALFRDRCDGGL